MHVAKPIALIALALSFVLGCSQAVEEQDVVGSEQALSSVTDIDFSEYPLGPLGAPWTTNTVTNGTVTVVNATADHGKVLRAHSENYSSIQAETAMVAAGPNLDVQFDVKPGPNTAFILEIVGSRTDRSGAYGHRTLHFTLTPSGDFSGDSGACGSLPMGVWSSVRLLFHTDTPTKVYDAWVNGARICTGQSFSQTFGFPTRTIGIRSSNLYVFKGDVLYDNFLVQTGS